MLTPELVQQIRSKNSCLCIGLDTELSKIPSHFGTSIESLYLFNKTIIEATLDLCVAYKPNIAFYESLGTKGWDILERTMALIPDTHFTIADAKRGDIGNTSKKYAETFFNTFDFDAVTVAPYMGRDSVLPFLDYKDKVTIILGMTSNEGSRDFQQLRLQSGNYLYETVIEECSHWGTPQQLMFVVGATQAASLTSIRKIIPKHFLLVPGIGAQGGDVQDVITYGKNKDIGLLINASRSILYASKDKDFADAARREAQNLNSLYAHLL
ncbi:MAG: orotidine-5'-phosphate decarboxylase [Saprospiraceae bacterium]